MQLKLEPTTDSRCELEKGPRSIIAGFKEEICTIREGISKLIRVKSQENLKIVEQHQKSVLSQLRPAKFGGRNEGIINNDVKILHHRIRCLEDQNKILHERLKQKEHQEKAQKNRLLSRNRQLEQEHEILQNKIKCLASEIEHLRGSRSTAKKSSTKKLQEGLQQKNFSPSKLNPQLLPPLEEKQDMKRTSYLSYFIKQNDRLCKDLQKISANLGSLQKSHAEVVKLVSELNEQLVKNQMRLSSARCHQKQR